MLLSCYASADLFLLKRIGTWPTCAFIGQSVSSNASKRERSVAHARLAECAGNNSNEREININGSFTILRSTCEVASFICGLQEASTVEWSIPADQLAHRPETGPARSNIDRRNELGQAWGNRREKERTFAMS